MSGPPVRPGWRTGGKLSRLLPPALALVLFVLLLIALQDLSRHFAYHTVIHHLRHLRPELLVLALLATALSYVGLIGRDWLALRALGARLPRPTLLVGAIAGSALGNAVGFGMLTGGAVRVRIFGTAGITTEQVVRITLLTSTTFAMGLVLFGGLGLAAAAPVLAAMTGTPAWMLISIGTVGVASMAALLAVASPKRPELRIRGISFACPTRRFLLAQLALSGLDVLGAGLTLWVLLPHTTLGFGPFMAIYTAALLLGVIGHTPGGLGVFEVAIIFALGHSVPPGAAVAALLVYRAVYFMVPLLVSAALMAGFEIRGVAIRLAPRAGSLARGPHLAPLFLGVITFAIGVMLIISGATPAFGQRLAILEVTLPLWVLEGSQFLGSLLGVLLLFVARGLFYRLDAAWWLALLLAVASLGLSLAEGLAFIEAGILLVLILLLLVSRRRFRRPASLFRQPFTLGWMISIAMVLTIAFWVLFFAFRNVPYSRDLWWQFEFDENAPRALRATLGATLLAAGIGLWQLLRLAPGRTGRPSAADMEMAARIVRGQERSSAVLAMMGDKSFLFSPDQRSFLMYVQRGRSWVALYDPVGPRADWPELIARFVAMAHAQGGRAAFYQVRPDNLPLYLDAGLKLLKLGEEACVCLHDFNLQGPRQTHLRYALRRGERDGLAIELVSPEQIGALLPTLRAISDAWLKCHRVRERGFSVATFDAAYLATQSVMLVRQNGVPVAFTSFMTTDLLTEATVGVMRHTPDASPYAMEYLFTKLALHLREAGFQNMSLGVVPLSGLAATPLASLWHRIGHLLWDHGGRLYNFRGLRTFKSKFHPVWEPRYLAASGVFGPFLALADVAVRPGGGRT